MDQFTKVFLARILGETYRLQRRVDPNMVAADPDVEFGLIHGIESAIESAFGESGPAPLITKEKVRIVGELLENAWGNLESFEGWYDLSHEMSGHAISVEEAFLIFKYFKAGKRFDQVLEKIDAGDTPSNIQIELEAWEK